MLPAKDKRKLRVHYPDSLKEKVVEDLYYNVYRGQVTISGVIERNKYDHEPLELILLVRAANDKGSPGLKRFTWTLPEKNP